MLVQNYTIGICTHDTWWGIRKADRVSNDKQVRCLNGGALGSGSRGRGSKTNPFEQDILTSHRAGFIASKLVLRPHMTKIVDWDAKPHFDQTNRAVQPLWLITSDLRRTGIAALLLNPSFSTAHVTEPSFGGTITWI